MDLQEWRVSWGVEYLTYLPNQAYAMFPVATAEFLSEFGLPRRVIFNGDGANEISFADFLMQPMNLSAAEF